jgi:uncharacterized protein (TIGR02466 family)
MNYNIANMFPTPVLKFDFSKHKDNGRLLELIESWDTAPHQLVSGAQSSYMRSDKHILDHEDLKDLKADFQKAVDVYCEKVGLGKNVKISMSWFNVLQKGQSVNLHRHEVSILSAAYYVRSDKDSAGLNFRSPIDPYRMHEFFVQNTEYNVKNVEVPCEQGALYLFPSWLEHYTNQNQTDKRITISFNTMYV